MRKWISLLLITLLLLTCALAGAEEAQIITSSIDDGVYFIRIPLKTEDEDWRADELAEAEGLTLKLVSAQAADGCFEARYAAEGEGTATVSLRRFEGAACVELHTWDLKAENGKIVESVGGSFTASPSDEELEAALAGEWLEAETQFTRLSIERNPEGGFDVELSSPISHAAYILRARAFMDCEQNALVWVDGARWNAPLTDAELADPGEPLETGLTGSLTLGADEDALLLVWPADQNPEGREIAFAAAGKE